MRRTRGEDASGAHNVGRVNRIEPVAGISHSRCALLRLGRVSPVVLAEVCVSVCRLTLANLTAPSSLTGVRAGYVRGPCSGGMRNLCRRLVSICTRLRPSLGENSNRVDVVIRAEGYQSELGDHSCRKNAQARDSDTENNGDDRD